MLELAVVEVLLVAVAEEPPVDEAEAGSVERTASWVKVADKPVPLLQTEGVEGAVPATKLTAAHCGWSALRSQMTSCFSYLVENSIRSILHNPKDALLSCEGSWDRNGLLAEIAQPGLLNSWEKGGPVARGSGVESCTKKPGCLGVNGCQGNCISSNIVIRYIILREVGSERATGSAALELIIESNCGREIQIKMGSGLADKEGCNEADIEDRGHLRRVCCCCGGVVIVDNRGWRQV